MKLISARKSVLLSWSIALSVAVMPVSVSAAKDPVNPLASVSAKSITDDALVKSLPGFKRGFATVNGVRLHYVEGGKGDPVLLLPGWPQTWWSYNKVMPELAKRYRVIAIDIRGMGASGKPAGGYDKKTMAADIEALVTHLKLPTPHIVGHDIGAQVAHSYAANYPQRTRTLTLLDVAHPDDSLGTWPLMPKHGTFGEKIDENNAYAWWFAFHQVKGLPEQLLEGRAYIEQAWFFRYLMKDERAINLRDRAVYANAYNSRDAIRAGNAWYQAFTQDMIDERSYGTLRMPILGLAGPGYGWVKGSMDANASTNARVVQLKNSGHFVAEEQPEEMLRYLLEFLSKN